MFLHRLQNADGTADGRPGEFFRLAGAEVEGRSGMGDGIDGFDCFVECAILQRNVSWMLAQDSSVTEGRDRQTLAMSGMTT